MEDRSPTTAAPAALANNPSQKEKRNFARKKELVTLPLAVKDILLRCKYYKLWAFIVGPLFPERTVGCFIEGTITYTLSKTINDLVTSYILDINPRAFCGEDCKAKASSSVFFTYALCTLPVAALVKRIAASKRLSHVPSIDTVAPMVGMVVGWGAGDAFTQLLVELKAEYSATLCSEPLYDGAPPNCSSFNFAYAAALTLVSALAIALVQPLTKSIECGSSAVIDSLEDWLKSVWQLVSKGFATAVMIVWNTTLS